MEKQHITYFKIENFKRFDSFEMANLGQFNLLVGDNNVGKKSVLEALALSEDRITLIYHLALSFLHRISILNDKWSLVFEDYIYQKDFWRNIIDLNKPLTLRYESHDGESQQVSIEFIDNEHLNEKDRDLIKEQPLVKKRPELWLRFYKNSALQGTFGQYGAECLEFFRSEKSYNSTLLRMNASYNNLHINSYYSIINPSKERRILFEEGLRFILSNLDEVRPHKIFGKEILGIVLKDDERIYPITQFGDGMIKTMRILLGIISCQGRRIMIDELDAGIHFSRIKEYWKTIISLCSGYNVQLFATTHSLECQQAFVEALEDPEMQTYQKDARNISLIEDKKGNVKAVTYDFEQFEYALNIGFNTRGGKA